MVTLWSEECLVAIVFVDVALKYIFQEGLKF